MGEWKQKKLGEILTLQRGYDLPSRDRRDGTVPIVSSSGITGYHDTPKADGPGVVVGRYGTLGEVHYLEQPYWPLNTSLFVLDFKESHPRFISYLLKTIDYGQQNAAGAVPGVNRNHLHNLDVRVPVVRDQKRIASVLSEYDDLIENNAKRIDVLEEMARVLYREWFVQRARTNTTRPEWKRASFGQIVSLMKGTVAPNCTPETEYDLFSFEACDQGRLPLATFGRSIQSNKFVVSDGVVLLPKLNPHIPRVWLPFPEGDRAKICSTEFLVLRPAPWIPRSYLYSMVEDGSFSAGLAQRADGTSNSHKRLKPDDVLAQPVVVPPQALLDHYSAFADGVFEQCHVLRKKNRALRAARDLLLPKLLSGELSVDRIPDPAEVAP